MRQISRDYIKKFSDRIYEDLIGAKWAIIFIIAYFAVLRNFFYSSCPVVVVTGYPCPACGMTRAAFSILQMDFQNAIKIQPFIIWWIAWFLYFVIYRYVMLGNNYKCLKWLAIIGIIGMVLFYVWRMKNFFPGEPPMSYYNNNLISILKGGYERWIMK